MSSDPKTPRQIAMSLGDEEDGLSMDHTSADHVLPSDGQRANGSSDTPIHGSYQRQYKAAPLDDFDVSLLALAHARGVGPKTLRQLIDQFEELSQVWTADQELLSATLQRAKAKDSAKLASTLLEQQDELRTAAERDLRRLQGDGIQLIGRHHPSFPRRLAHVPDAPYWLFVEGSLAALDAPLIGIVGTRKPSKIGVQTAERLAAIVCREGFGIVSGLAEGIDASAHRVGLYYQAPQIAVLGTGIDIVFPASTEGIRWKILDAGGAVISEYLPGDSYSRANFVQRNRIQAALSLALSPVESLEQSGTAHTVRFATQYGRPIFGVQRGQPAAQNEMVSTLVAQGHPVFDLAQPHSVKELVNWLRTVVSADAWPTEGRQVDTHWFFQDVLRQIDDILADTPVSHADARWLQEQIAERLRVFPSDSTQDAA